MRAKCESGHCEKSFSKNEYPAIKPFSSPAIKMCNLKNSFPVHRKKNEHNPFSHISVGSNGFFYFGILIFFSLVSRKKVPISSLKRAFYFHSQASIDTFSTIASTATKLCCSIFYLFFSSVRRKFLDREKMS